MSEISPKPTVKWHRAIRPLLLWGILVLMIVAYRAHVRLSANTRIRFSPMVTWKTVGYESAITIDGRPASNGQRIPIGWHTLAIAHPEARPFSTNLFIWYGENELGQLVLEQAMGQLLVKATPPAARIEIRGSQFSAVVTNTSEFKASVPADTYVITATYAHWSKLDKVTVLTDQSTVQSYAPNLVSLQVAASHPDIKYQLLGSDYKEVASGLLPTTITELPEGNYQLISTRLTDQRVNTLTLEGNATNEVRVEFVYGTVVIETTPPGASVLTEDGNNLGVTPLTLKDRSPGQLRYRLERDGWESVVVALELTANQTSVLRTNLLSVRFAPLMATARREMAAQNFVRAVSVLTEALELNPNDTEAIALRSRAAGYGYIQLAKSSASRNDFAASISHLQTALLALPENEEAKRLMELYKNGQQGQNVERQNEILARPQRVFEQLTARWFADASPYDAHEFKTKLSVQEVEQKLRIAFINDPPVFLTTPYEPKFPDAFALGAYQQLPDGARRCLIGGSQVGDETKFYYKILEYTKGSAIGIKSSTVVLNPTFSNLTEQQMKQIADGIQLVSGRIQKALK